MEFFTMIRKILPFLIILSLVSIIVILFLSLASTKKMIVVQEGNLNQVPIEMEVGKFQDSDCGMTINDLTDLSQVIIKSGKSWFFHDHGGLVRSEEHTSELQSHHELVCRPLLEKKKHQISFGLLIFYVFILYQYP